MKIIRAFSGRNACLRLGTKQWSALLSELGHRGHGKRESGAFLLSPTDGDGRTISRVLYFDDLDPESLTGGIHFRREGYAKLAAECKSGRERVVADVHTHPGSWVGQSPTDQANPMVSRAGHVALIVPRYSQGSFATRDVGFHIYDGSKWMSFLGRAVQPLLYVGRWP